MTETDSLLIAAGVVSAFIAGVALATAIAWKEKLIARLELWSDRSGKEIRVHISGFTIIKGVTITIGDEEFEKSFKSCRKALKWARLQDKLCKIDKKEAKAMERLGKRTVDWDD